MVRFSPLALLALVFATLASFTEASSFRGYNRKSVSEWEISKIVRQALYEQHRHLAKGDGPGKDRSDFGTPMICDTLNYEEMAEGMLSSLSLFSSSRIHSHSLSHSL